MTFHAAYEPQRAVRTERWKYIRRFGDYPHPVLANCDDSASKEMLSRGRVGRPARRRRSSSTTSCSTPTRRTTCPLDRAPARRETSCPARRLLEWMGATDDPLLDGPVEPPPGRSCNDPTQVSPNDP